MRTVNKYSVFYQPKFSVRVIYENVNKARCVKKRFFNTLQSRVIKAFLCNEKKPFSHYFLHMPSFYDLLDFLFCSVIGGETVSFLHL